MKITQVNISSEQKKLIQSVFIYESDTLEKRKIPFYADGFPGIVFFHSEQPMMITVGSESKVMEQVFVYGQTIVPIEIKLEGPFFFVMLQLVPAVLEEMFGIPVSELTNSCWTIPKSEWNAEPNFHSAIKTFSTVFASDALISFVMKRGKQFRRDSVLHACIEEILEAKGNCEIGKLSKRHGLSERTLQRRFENYVGLSPKQFAKIIRFQSSLQILNRTKDIKLTEIAYEGGYSDQSHFIRHFKTYTKQRPFQFREKI
ncbi:AraC family transcriptional regulator [Leptospira ognonensis]|uniref:AraC family transcriptional regulator n=1 Tax=Leptospira ognonensis TaxID=2484945 RepID=A0A4R9JZE7_9LEPT|nr:helix-turn-helix domain-containing protein [Leptospira ognonensis]TGL56998.1 AraC family transcriptional regulator [Leptospira ognonensis]